MGSYWSWSWCFSWGRGGNLYSLSRFIFCSPVPIPIPLILHVSIVSSMSLVDGQHGKNAAYRVTCGICYAQLCYAVHSNNMLLILWLHYMRWYDNLRIPTINFTHDPSSERYIGIRMKLPVNPIRPWGDHHASCPILNLGNDSIYHQPLDIHGRQRWRGIIREWPRWKEEEAEEEARDSRARITIQ